MTTYTTTHPVFPHLPAGPWRFAGSGREVYQAIPGDPSCPLQPGGCCDHCSTGIFDCYYFEATQTGERFKVGSTCVSKMIAAMVADDRERREYRSLSAAERAVKDAKNAKARERAAVRRKADREHRAAKAAVAKTTAQELLAANRTAAEGQPHPLDWRAEKGDTLADWADWMLAHGGANAFAQVTARLLAL